ncbi:adenylate/guanylate cyclase domain-containing protein [Thermodesulfobacteriota bacterium]
MKCPKCQFENPEDSKFCFECGEKMELKCPKCGKALPIGVKFCNECGHDLRKPSKTPPVDYSAPQAYTPKFLADKILKNRSAIEGERKLVTVLFADVADFTAMSEKLDPEEIHQIMDGCFKILLDEIHLYEGTINQFTGDGVMALFGAPVSHEDHAQRACYAALSIQKAIKEYGQKVRETYGVNFEMRIGLNSGPVVVGSIGDNLRMDYTAIGDTTNLAARLESSAEPGSILLSKETQRLVRDFFEFQSLGKIDVKGKEEQQQAFELVKASEVETRISAAVAKGLTRFVGRKNSMAGLMSAYELAKSGSGQVVGMVGEAGVGKSRLLFEFRNRLPQDEIIYFEGRCLHYGGSMIYLPIVDIMRSFFDIKDGDGGFVVRKKIENKVLKLDENLRKILSPIQELLSVKVEDEVYLQVDSGQRKIWIFEAVRDLLAIESQNKTVVIAVEDLHWIDKTSQEFLSYLIDWLADVKILLILLYRPEYTHPWGSKSHYKRIGLTQLTAKSSTELVQAILEGGEVVPELRELILSRAGGNPLYLEELSHNMLENGTIQRKDHEYILTRDASEIEVPDTIQGIIAARLDRVEESLKRIMQMASVIGREFAFRILQTIMEMKEGLKSSLINLQGLEFISQKRLFPELEYIFKHALTQEVAYSSLLKERRKKIHEKIGQAIENLYPENLEEYYELLAYHYTRSDNKDKALAYLDLANQKAIKLNAFEDAMIYFNDSMKLLDTLPEIKAYQQRRISMLVSQWIVFELLFKFPEYYELLTRYEATAIDLGNKALLGLIYACKGHCEWWFGQLDRSGPSLTKGAELNEAGGNALGAGYAYMQLTWHYAIVGELEKAIACKDKALLALEQQFNLRLYVWSLCPAAAASAWLGHWNEAEEQVQKALSVAEKYSDNSLISFGAWMFNQILTLKGDLQRALKYAELSLQKASAPADRSWSESFLGWLLCRLGDFDKGIQILTTYIPIYLSADFLLAKVIFGTPLGEGYWLAGEYDKAKQTLKDVLKTSEQCGMKFYTGMCHRIMGEVNRKINSSQAPQSFEKSIVILHEIKAENELAMAYAGYGRFYKQQGDMMKAREYLTKALEIFERLGTPTEPDKVREILAELREG